MIWELKNTVGVALGFPCILMIFQLLAWVLWRRKRWISRILMTVSVLGLVVLSSPGVSGPLLDLIESEVPPLNLAESGLADRAEAIVVLGAGSTIAATEYSRDVVSPNGFLRLRYAMELYRKTGKPILLTGGSAADEKVSEAALMGESLQQSFGVRAQWLEEKSVNSFENAQFSFKLLSLRGIQRVFLVTHASHMPRAARSFERAGFTVVPAPMGFMTDDLLVAPVRKWLPSARGIEMSAVFFHEAIGSLWYALWGV